MKLLRKCMPWWYRARPQGPIGAASGVPGFPSWAMVADMLSAPTALMQLKPEEARTVVHYMRPMQVARGSVFIREGDSQNTGFMVLILEGDVTVESIMVSRVAPTTVTVLGPGSMHGELGLMDGSPRSASCTAGTDLKCAVLTREGLSKMLHDDPEVCAKLMMAIALRIGGRLRDNTEKLKKYALLAKAMQQEIDHLLTH
ncbi:MAG: cyclic nucleotide-binding domain-containing protein [Rhodoferax sp.]|uniref:cyclic nucleotide-binding domain-containing protein n=1 Tax=Rhodoferax sp. TaxID=50421 RepID=UPI0026BDAE8C|nr:cyclic nucleotide-binding domain-containing protein [Rhodoferax sp.]MDP2678319.1 cyclic nucleotide-binding domain-containing protein [Rhodoferax sp.]